MEATHDELRTESLVKIYNKQAVVDQVDIRIESGQIVGLLGRNGAGKTTTFLMLAGIVKPDEGAVFLNGDNMEGIPSHERAEKGLVYLPQQHSIYLKESVYQNLFMVLELKLTKDEARRKTDELLNEFGLSHIRDSKSYNLSGGEKRRLEIARALIMKPKFLFLDEPFTGIDPITILDIQKVLIKLKEKGIGIIITDHNVKDTFTITDSVYILQKGKILSSGPPEIVVKEEKTRQLFLGEDFQWNL